MLSPGRLDYPTGTLNTLPTSGQESTEDESAHLGTPGKSTKGQTSDGAKRKRPKFIRKVPCHVCGDVANDHIHYGAIACYSCRAFFRRGVSNNVQFFCSQNNDCKIDKTTRKHCQACRLKKCFEIGMKDTWVMTEEDKEEKKRKSLHRKLMAPHVDKEVLRIHTKTSYEERMRNERIQSRAAKKRSRLASKEEKSSTEAMEVDTASNVSAPSPDPLESLPPLTPLKKIRLDLEIMPPPSMYLASHALLYEKEEAEVTGEAEVMEVEPLRSYDHDEIRILGNFGRPLLINRKSMNYEFHGLNHGPSMNFTHEERSYIKHLWETEMQTAQSIPVPVATLCQIRDAVKSGSVLPMEAAVEGYKICMQRVVEYAKKVDEFQKIPQNDQFNLLLRNIDMIVNIRTARFLRPSANLRDRLADVTGVQTPTSSALGARSNPASRMEIHQLFPSTWASNGPYEQQYSQLMRSIFELHMDTQTTTLLSMMALFSLPTNFEAAEDSDLCLETQREVQERQHGFSLLLYRYLVATVGKINANSLVEEYRQILGNLQKMAEILASKKLRIVELTL